MKSKLYTSFLLFFSEIESNFQKPDSNAFWQFRTRVEINLHTFRKIVFVENNRKDWRVPNRWKGDRVTILHIFSFQQQQNNEDEYDNYTEHILFSTETEDIHCTTRSSLTFHSYRRYTSAVLFPLSNRRSTRHFFCPSYSLRAISRNQTPVASGMLEKEWKIVT